MFAFFLNGRSFQCPALADAYDILLSGEALNNTAPVNLYHILKLCLALLFRLARCGDHKEGQPSEHLRIWSSVLVDMFISTNDLYLPFLSLGDAFWSFCRFELKLLLFALFLDIRLQLPELSDG